MPEPFFSIIIPTKNRSAVLEQAITTVFRQTHEDWELIVVDNDDTEETAQVCRKFPDPRLKYIRTGGLCMSDNWERGLQEARGDYVTFLQDKNFLRRNALSRMAETLRLRDDIEFLGWRVDCIMDNETPPRLARSKTTRTLQQKSSREILERLSRDMDAGGFMPFPNYGFLSRSLLRQILSGPPQQLCLGLDPAQGGALQILANTSTIFLHDEALFVHAYNKLSNGKNADRMGEAFKRLNQDNRVDETAYFAHVPIKTITVINAAFNEYVKIREIIGRNLLPAMDLPGYFLSNYVYFWNMRTPGGQVWMHLKRWREALAQQSPEVRAAVQEGLKNQPSPLRARLKRLAKQTRRLLCIDKIEQFLKGRKRPVWPFKSPLEYVIWADEHEK